MSTSLTQDEHDVSIDFFLGPLWVTTLIILNFMIRMYYTGKRPTLLDVFSL